MKFDEMGCDPLNANRQLNFIEQLNQTFTYLTSLLATETLLTLHPDLAPFTLNLGTNAGSDIESNQENSLAAEIFAAVNTSNNRKLAKDIAKVSVTNANLKYVFFMCPGFKKGRFQQLETHSDVQVWSVGTMY